MQDPDGALAARVANGDERAFGLLVSRHVERVRAVANGYLGNRADADDVAQDVFLVVWNKCGQYDPAKGQFATWLYRIVANRAIDHRRKRRWFVFADIGDHADDLPDADDPHATLSGRQDLETVRRAIRSLPDRQRMALLLSVSAGLSNTEIAEALAVTRGSVEQLLVRARAALRATAGADRP